MPRDIRYRKEFVAQNDVYWRVDIIPGDNTLFDWNSNLHFDLGDETLLSISDIEINYRDELPFGFPEYSPLEIEFNLDTIPADLKEYLTTGFKPGTETSDSIASNLCVVWSSDDEGETYTPIWVGVQTPQLISEITISSNDRAITKITFQPLQTAVLSRCKWQFLNKYFDDTDTVLFNDFNTVKRNRIFSYLEFGRITSFPPVPPFAYQAQPAVHAIMMSNDYGNTSANDNFWIFPYPLKTIFEVIRREIQAVFKYITRQATSINRISADKTNDFFEWEYDRYIGNTGVMKVRKAQNNFETDLYDRLGDYLAFEDIWVPFIIDPDGLSKTEFVNQGDTNQTVGGILNVNDIGSFPAQYKTFNEFIIALSEFSCSKMIINYSFTNKLKMKFEVFGALERTNSNLPASLNLFDDSASESLTAEIGYICSSTEAGNSKAVVKAPSIPAQSPILTDLAKSQTFTIKNAVFSWDVSIPDPIPNNDFAASNGIFRYTTPPDSFQIRGYEYINQLPIPCTTLFYSGGDIKITEYIQVGDTTKINSDGVIYYETDDFLQDSMLELYELQGGQIAMINYLKIYKWQSKWHIRTGTAKQLTKLFSKILTNAKNWMLREAQVYNKEQFELGSPNKLIGHRVSNVPPETYQVFLGLPSEGVITSLKLNISSGLYTLTSFQSGFLKEI